MQIDLSKVPGVVTITNEGERPLKVNISGVHQSLPLQPGDEVLLLAQTSSELIGYLSQVTDDNGLAVSLPTVVVGG